MNESIAIGIGYDLHKFEITDGQKIIVKFEDHSIIMENAFIDTSGDSTVIYSMANRRSLKNVEKKYMVKIGGVDIPHCYPIKAHSDGDLLIHAIVDAILGSISSTEDIGTLFPDTDPKYKDADSRPFLEAAIDELHKAKRQILNIDLIIVCEAPKISPYKNKILDNLADILKISKKFISLRGKTSEKIGHIGKKEGIECYAIVSTVRII